MKRKSKNWNGIKPKKKRKRNQSPRAWIGAISRFALAFKLFFSNSNPGRRRGLCQPNGELQIKAIGRFGHLPQGTPIGRWRRRRICPVGCVWRSRDEANDDTTRWVRRNGKFYNLATISTKFKPLPNSTSSLKDKLKNASSLIKKLSDNQFTTAKKSQLPRGTSQPDLLADLGVERFTLSPF